MAERVPLTPPNSPSIRRTTHPTGGIDCDSVRLPTTCSRLADYYFRGRTVAPPLLITGESNTPCVGP